MPDYTDIPGLRPLLKQYAAKCADLTACAAALQQADAAAASRIAALEASVAALTARIVALEKKPK